MRQGVVIAGAGVAVGVAMVVMLIAAQQGDAPIVSPAGARPTPAPTTGPGVKAPVVPPLPPEKLQGLLRAFEESSGQASRVRAAHAIALTGRGAAAGLPEMLAFVEAETDPLVRAKLIWAVGELRDPAAATALARFARDDSESSVRAQAVAAIIRCGMVPAAEALAAIDAEREPAIRAAWLNTFEGPLDDSARDTLVRLGRDDVAPAVRGRALVRAAERMETLDGPVGQVLEDRLLRDGDLVVRQAAAVGLLRSGRPDARALVERARDNASSPQVRDAIQAMLDSPEVGSTPTPGAQGR